MLWAITSYFNPAGWKSRLFNYRIFRKHLGVPLVAVEFSVGGRFELQPGDADILIQLDDGDILFQKERLLNIGLESVPADCTGIVWPDADVVFGDEEWHQKTLAALERHAVVQPFSERCDLPPGAGPDEILNWDRPPDRPSLAARFSSGELTVADLFPKNPRTRNTAWGLAWAARKDVLDRHGFYDAFVMSSGDVAIFCAAIGAADARLLRERMNDLSHQHYLEWALPFQETVQGKVGCVEGRIFHLWHGSLQNRRYSSNVTELRDLAFDPYQDIVKSRQGCWRWASDKPKLHDHVRRYFWDRNEDGDPREAVLPSAGG